MKIRELIRELEAAAEEHGNIFAAIPTGDHGFYNHIVSAQVNKNKGESLGGYPIVEFDGQAIFVIR